MRPIVQQNFFQWSRKFEGYVQHMYLDVKGLVTTGVGNLIDPVSAALSLPWRYTTGILADRSAILAEWSRIKSHTELAKQGFRAAGKIATLHLDADAIESLVKQKANSFWDWMRTHYFPDCDSWPACAQLATLSMAWALGPGFPVTFKNYAAAAKRQDWKACAAACGIKTAGNPGIVPRNAANVALLLKASTQTPDQYGDL